MKYLMFIVFSLAISACSVQSAESQPLGRDKLSGPADNKTPVLVELFTSEGCSSCPPAERVLAKLQLEQPFEKAEIITLALHVDYWDDLGWKDKFSSPLYTQRQQFYDRKFRTGRIYTPQMVVDGEQEFVGSNFEKAEKAINKAIDQKKAEISVSLAGGKLKIDVTNIPKHDQSTIYLALTEDNLKTDIKGGENAGKNLSHVSVVRSLKGLSKIEEGKQAFQMEVPLQIGKDWDPAKTSAVIFIQENRSRRIIGVSRMPAA
ncbi:MAG: DUF1223 domain-containing protein [Acidobacteria bacterium]|nr:DUF1223 domain-containing protein [Acidobacteriota bacterium]